MRLVPLSLDFPAEVAYPTACGGRLILDGYNVQFSYTLSTIKPEHSDWTVIQSTSYLFDGDGAQWRCITHISSLQLLGFFYAPRPLTSGECGSTVNPKGSHWESALQAENVLAHAGLCDDTRDLRRHYLPGGHKDFFVKYNGIPFTIGHVLQTWPVSRQTSLLVLHMAHSFQEYLNGERGDFIDHQVLVPVDPERILFLNTAIPTPGPSVSGNMLDQWEDSPIPLPLVFEKTGEFGQKQEGVHYLPQNQFAPGNLPDAAA